MKKESSVSKKRGFSLIEAIIAVAIFGIILGYASTGLLGSRKFLIFSGKHQRAAALAEEGLEAARNLRDSSFANLVDGAHGILGSGTSYVFSGGSDVKDIFTRKVYVSTIDATTKEVKSEISWQDSGKTEALSLSERLTNWRITKAKKRGGVFAFADGGTSSDSLKYRTLHPSDGTWSSISSMADVDTLTTNKAPFQVKIFASLKRDEKIVLSRHFDGTDQYVYAQVFNGSSWGNVQLLSSWKANTFLDVNNFDGAYLDNGDFMAVYSDNTKTPKFRIWSGSSWGSQISTPALPDIPVFMVSRARPNTNEVMVAIYDQQKRSRTLYYNGNGYSTGNWTLHPQHGANGPTNARQLIDFDWSPNNVLVGQLVYTNNNKSIQAKTFTANGTGGGVWSTQASSTTQAQNNGPICMRGRNGANEFMIVEKDNSASPGIFAFKTDFAPLFTNPSNQTLTTVTSNGNERSFDADFEGSSGAMGIAVYSDNTSTAKLKKYDPINNSWDSSPISAGTLGSTLRAVELVAQRDGNDIIVIMMDGTRVYTRFWDGAADIFYSSPSDKDLKQHGSNAPGSSQFWADFAWDQN